MKRERYEALKRMAADNSGASDNERLIAEALLGQADDISEAIRKTREPRITVSKGVSGNSLVVRRKDGKGAVTIMMPVDDYAAVEFCNSSLRIRLTDEEEYIVCEKLN